MKQESLFAVAPIFQTRVISRRRDFEGLFAGFSKMRAITYVASPDLLLELLEKRGYTLVEIVVGDSLAPARLPSEWQRYLIQKGLEVTERLAERVENGRLSILDRELRCVLMGLNGSRVVMTEALPEAAVLDRALAHVEKLSEHCGLRSNRGPELRKDRYV